METPATLPRPHTTQADLDLLLSEREAEPTASEPERSEREARDALDAQILAGLTSF